MMGRIPIFMMNLLFKKLNKINGRPFLYFWQSHLFRPSKLSWVRGEGMVLASKQESMHNPGGSLQSVDVVERLSVQGPHPLGDGHGERRKLLCKGVWVDIQRDAG